MSFLYVGSERRWLLLLALIALLVRLGWAVAMMDRSPQFDEVEYINLAERLATGEGYVDESGRPVAYWPIGYPALLSLVFRAFGPSRWAAVALQITLGVAACLLLSVLGSRGFGLRSGRLAGLLWALYPTHVMYSTLHLTEPLFMLLLLGTIGCLVAGKRDSLAWSSAAGLLLGLAALTRPLIVMMPLVLPFALRDKGQSLKRAGWVALTVGATMLVVVSPWLWRNHQLTGRWTTLTTSGGYNFWVGNQPEARGGYARTEDLPRAETVIDEIDWHRGYSWGWQAIRSNPMRALLKMPLKVSHFVALETDGVLWNLKGLDRAPPMVWILSLLLVANLAYWGGLGSSTLALLSGASRTRFGRMTVWLTGYFVVIVMVFFGDPRFHLPLMPFLLLCGASVLSGEQPHLRSDSSRRLNGVRRQWAVWFGLLVVIGLLMVINLAVKRPAGAW